MNKSCIVLVVFFSLLVSDSYGTINRFIGDSLPIVDQKVTYTNVVELDSISKNILFKNAITFINNYTVTFNNTLNYEKNRIQNPISYSSIDSGEIIASLKIRLQKLNLERLFSFTLKLKFKDNRYKYELTDFVQLGINTGIIAGPIYENVPIESFYKTAFKPKHYAAFNDQISKFIVSLYTAVKRRGNTDNW